MPKGLYLPTLFLILSGLFVQSVGAVELTATRVAAGFDKPVYGTAPDGDADRLFILEQNTGRIRILMLESGAVLDQPFLDLPGTEMSSGGERGLLGMAFHPDYATNGRFFLNFTGPDGRTVIREYLASSDPDRADPASGKTLLEIDQPFSNHNGGWLGFGPDGMLYIATGDGGSANDPGDRSQDITQQLLGKILRIDPGPVANGQYAIPQDNPFVGIGGDDEIWAYGLRNPWRCAFDRSTGEFWIADVGQAQREWIHLQPAGEGGQNYGWRVMEGNRSTGLGGMGPPPFDPSITSPIHEYTHSEGVSITGGYVYRGARYPQMNGLYLFADYLFKTIWSLERGPGGAVTVIDRSDELTPDTGVIGRITSFAEGGLGELYLVDYSGQIFRIGAQASAAGNLSTRARIGSVSDVAIAGFVLEGTGGVDLLIRGVGPGLAQFQVSGPLDDPAFKVFQNVDPGRSVLLLANEDWGDGGAGSAIRSAEALTGAFALSDGSADAAAIASLDAGSYTQVLRGADGDMGIGLLEVYVIGESDGRPTAPILRNISTRAAVEAGSGALIAGFVLEGTGVRRFLIRGIGPGLSDFGVVGAIADPRLEVFRVGDISPVAINDDWEAATDPMETADAAVAVGAFPLDSGSADSALVIDLEPGLYTGRVSSGDSQSGVALVEIYLLP